MSHGIEVDAAPIALRDGSHVRIRQGRHLFHHPGPVQIVDREAGTVEIEVAIPAAGVAPELKELLRLAAEHDIAVPVGHRETSV